MREDVPIDRRTPNFHIVYRPNGPLIIRRIVEGREEQEPYFWNHRWQDDFGYSPGMSDLAVEDAVNALVSRQAPRPR